jgi:hypothetical protein
LLPAKPLMEGLRMNLHLSVLLTLEEDRRLSSLQRLDVGLPLSSLKRASEDVKEGKTHLINGAQAHAPLNAPSASTLKRDGQNRTYSDGINDNWSLTVRRLLQPSEIAALSPRIAITFAAGIRPIISWPKRYYETSAFQRVGSPSRIFSAVKMLWVAMTLCVISIGLAFKITHAAVRIQAERSNQLQYRIPEGPTSDWPDVPARRVKSSH